MVDKAQNILYGAYQPPVIREEEMVDAGTTAVLEARIDRLEDQLLSADATVEQSISGLDARLRRVESPAARFAPPASLADGALARAAGSPARADRADSPPRAAQRATSSTLARAQERSGMSLADLLGGRVLAWLGGVATLLGIVLFLVMAVSHGWIGEGARVLLAGSASAALMLAGSWLHRHRGRTEAAMAMVGVASAGMFATLIVASGVYGLLADSLALIGTLLVGALTTALAIRWAGRTIGGLGLVGALLAGVLVGAPESPLTIAILAVAACCAMTVVVWQRWGWLALCTVLVAAPQWAVWVLNGQPAALELLVLVVFAALGLLGAVAAQARSAEPGVLHVSAVVASLSALLVAVVGWVALGDAAGTLAGNLWLAGLAGAHLLCGTRRVGRVEIAPALRRLLIAIGVALADVCFALSAQGLLLALGWSASAVMFAWLARREAVDADAGEGTLLEFGVGVHIALALLVALLDAPPSELGGAGGELPGLLSLAALAAACIASGILTSAERAGWRAALNGLGLAAIAYLTASALGGAYLTAAWAFEGLALMRLQARRDDHVTRYGAPAFIAAAVLHALAFDASPLGLGGGRVDLRSAALGLGSLAIVGMRVGVSGAPGSPRRHWPLVGAGAALLYLLSLLVVSAFDPASASVVDGALELSVGQQAQVALSGLWSVVGVGALILGLRLNISPLRSAALALLLATVAKVFVFDLSTLTSVYRVTSFIVLGLLLLAGAFAYQRLRPPPHPDLGMLHPSQQ
jgi:uncharacterized membrane protein